jgi:D-alanine--poly(phosphoribitol) ligase subunit 1
MVTPVFGPSPLRSLPSGDRAQFRKFGHGPHATVPFGDLGRAIATQVARRPRAVALEHCGTSMTYGELDWRADRLAGLLVELGVRPGDRVGVFLTRSVSMVVGILAVLKAGAAYVPQDVRITPPPHLRHVVETAGIRVTLTTSEHLAGLPDEIGDVIAIDTVKDGPPLGRAVAPARFAAVIFTSGTTGRPNGVQITHTNLCNVLLAGPGSLGIGPGTRVSQLMNIAFDMAAWEILGTLAHGGTLVIRGADLAQAARTAEVIVATPTMLSTLDPLECASVRTVAVAGERCPPALAQLWSRQARFYNGCGPTEVTIVNTMQLFDPGAQLTIGRPLPNTTVYVLDENLKPCRIGEVGEMWAGGTCVTAGYIGNEALTSERYQPDPYLGGRHRMFRTRDLGRWTHDGQLEHHGRTDDQVKVRGFRVELDSVTAALERVQEGVRAATVLHEGRLIGFVSPSDVDPDLAKRAVERALPYYCVPEIIVPVDALPMTDRGKVDRRALLSILDTRAPVEAMA